MASAAGENDLLGLDEAQKNITLGLMSLFQPVVESIDSSVVDVQQSQDALLSQIDLLQEELNKFQGAHDMEHTLVCTSFGRFLFRDISYLIFFLLCRAGRCARGIGTVYAKIGKSKKRNKLR